MSSKEKRIIVVESPLAGDTQKNFRYALWCCRAWWLNDVFPIASHTNCPWYMDDNNPKEREAGIDWPWAWFLSVPHMFMVDLGTSNGMIKAMARCTAESISYNNVSLKDISPECWAAFEAGSWPPHTPGFSVEQNNDSTTLMRDQLYDEVEKSTIEVTNGTV